MILHRTRCGSFVANGYYGSCRDYVSNAVISCHGAEAGAIRIDIDEDVFGYFVQAHERVWGKCHDLTALSTYGVAVSPAFFDPSAPSSGCIRILDRSMNVVALLEGWTA